MKKTAYALSKADIIKLNDLKVEEIIISSAEFSRFAVNSFDELVEMLCLKDKISSKLIFEWDTLSQEGLFQKTVDCFKKLPLHEITEIRVQDPGVLHLIKENYSWMKIQLILETGNHNLEGLNTWKSYLGDRLSRLILSNELSKEHLSKYCEELNIPIEVLVFGRIILFYSPRKLLSPLEKDNIKKEIVEASGISEESPHSGFPLIENRHGTFMFNVKDLSLLQHIDELEELKVNTIRIDNRFDRDIFNYDQIIKELKFNEELKPPRPFIKGFYNINKTDVLFVKLKNKKIVRVDENYLGEVLDVEKSVNLCVLVKSELNFQFPFKVKIITPEGKEKIVDVFQILNSKGEKIDSAKNTGIVVFPFVNGVTVKSQIYFV